MKLSTLLCAVLLGLALPASAAWLVTTQGSRIETEGAWKVQGKLVVFTNAHGVLSSLRLSEIDLAASRKATEDAASANALRTTEPETLADPAPTPSPLAAAQPDLSAKPHATVTDESLRTGAGAPAGDWTSFPVSGHGTLDVIVPKGWTLEFRESTERDFPPTIVLKAVSAEGGELILTPEGSRTDDRSTLSPLSIRRMVEDLGELWLARSVERELRLNSIQSSSGHGYWFSITVTMRQPGDYEYMALGAVPAGELLVHFSARSHTAPPHGIQEALAVVGTVRQGL